MEFGIWEVENHAVSRSCQKHTVRISTKSERVFDVGGMSVISGTVVVPYSVLQNEVRAPTHEGEIKFQPNAMEHGLTNKSRELSVVRIKWPENYFLFYPLLVISN